MKVYFKKYFELLISIKIVCAEEGKFEIKKPELILEISDQKI